jgi:hypothetical protein
MPYSDAAKNLMLTALAAQARYVSLHSVNPGTAGTGELTGGAPAYARGSIAYGAAAAGTIDDSTNGLLFNVPAGGTVAYAGVWSAVSGGTFYGSGTVSSTEVFTGQGTYTLNDFKLDQSL